MSVQIREGTATDKENISGIYGRQRNHRIFAVGSHRNFDVCCPREALTFPAVRTSPLTSLWFVFFFFAILSISSMKMIPCSARSTSLSAAAKSLADHAFDIITDITRFGQGCGIRDGKRHIQEAVPVSSPDTSFRIRSVRSSACWIFRSRYFRPAVAKTRL